MNGMNGLLAFGAACWLAGVGRAEKLPVASSALDAVDFDEARGRLTLWFDHGGVHVYHEVPSSLFQHLLRSPSKGRFYQAHIRGRFNGECLQAARRVRAATPAILAVRAPRS